MDSQGGLRSSAGGVPRGSVNHLDLVESDTPRENCRHSLVLSLIFVVQASPRAVRLQMLISASHQNQAHRLL